MTSEKPVSTEEKREITLESVIETGGQNRTTPRDSLFYIGMVLISVAVSAALAYFAPVTSYDCQRDEVGVVGCSVHQRLYGLIPLREIGLSNLVSADTEAASHSHRDAGRTTGFSQTYSTLILRRADGTDWKSYASSDPLGMEHEDLALGIRELMEAHSPLEFHAWTAEMVPLLVAVAFLTPLMILGLAVLARLLFMIPSVRSFFIEALRNAIRGKK